MTRVPPALLRLEPDPQAVGVARRFARQRAGEFGADAEVQDAVVTLVSELVTNVVLHARTALVLQVADEAQWLRVSVVDGSASRPRLRRFGPQEATGRGVRLVRVLAADSGVDADAGIASGGKRVWFVVAKSAAARDEAAERAAMLDLFDVDDLLQGL